MTSLLAALETAPPQTLWAWVSALFSIIVIDVVLAGDNAVVIALAVRQLGPKQRLWGIALGSGFAVALRVGLTFVASRLLALNYIKLAGGVLILWIAVKLLLQNTHTDGQHRPAGSLTEAIWLIVVADITMSLDNVLAVAGASKGHFGLLLFGLGLSIPLVVFTSSLLAKLMDRYPIIVFVGAAILGKVGGEMLMTDRLTTELLAPSAALIHGVEVLCAAGVLGTAWLIRRKRKV